MAVSSGADAPPEEPQEDPADYQQNQNKKIIPGASGRLTEDEHDYLYHTTVDDEVTMYDILDKLVSSGTAPHVGTAELQSTTAQFRITTW